MSKWRPYVTRCIDTTTPDEYREMAAQLRWYVREGREEMYKATQPVGHGPKHSWRNLKLDPPGNWSRTITVDTARAILDEATALDARAAYLDEMYNNTSNATNKPKGYTPAVGG
jgi:hypothetical protein